jgi:chemotaxis protein methyltransferase CheR
VITANPAFYSTFKTTPAETEGRLVYALGNRQWDIPKLKKLLGQVIPQHAVFSDFERKYNFLIIGPKTMLLNARYFQSDQQKFILLAIEVVTIGKSLEA